MAILLIHIAAALGSIAWSTYLLIRPSKVKLNVSYGLVATTLASGTYLVISTHSGLVQACAMGLVYIGGVSAAIITARTKLARQTQL